MIREPIVLTSDVLLEYFFHEASVNEPQYLEIAIRFAGELDEDLVQDVIDFCVGDADPFPYFEVDRFIVEEAADGFEVDGHIGAEVAHLSQVVWHCDGGVGIGHAGDDALCS